MLILAGTQVKAIAGGGDRLSRRLSDLVPIVEDLTKLGVTFRSVTELFDTVTPSGRAMMQVLGVFAGLERATIIERTKVGIEKRARLRLWLGAIVPFGYGLDEMKALVPEEDGAVVVRRMLEMYANLKDDVSTICTRLNSMGYRKRKGGKWDRGCRPPQRPPPRHGIVARRSGHFLARSSPS